MFRFYIALMAAKLSRIAINLLHGIIHTGGSNFPGQLAIKICPDFLKYVSKPDTIIAVTGTNGKTTLSNMVSDIFEDNGHSVISNRAGSNMAAGVATALSKDVTPGNKSRSEIAVLEVDEKSSIAIYKHIRPDYFVCTQLARDSMMRNAHPYYIFDIIEEALPSGVNLILNADDLISFNLKEENPRALYSIAKQEGESVEPSLVNDARVCPECNSLLDYDFTRYGHIGRAKCPSCGFQSPEGKYIATPLDESRMVLTISEGQSRFEYPMVSDSIFNVYDEVAAIALFRELGYPQEKIASSLSKLHVVDSRYSRDVVDGVEVVSNMTKSLIAPACSAVFDYVRSRPGEKEIVLFIEDPHTVDNNSYMYDTDFEYLNDPLIKKIIIVGKKPQEFFTRFLFAGVPRDKMVQVPAVDDAIQHLSFKRGTAIYLLYDNYQVDNNIRMRKLILDALKEGAANE